MGDVFAVDGKIYHVNVESLQRKASILDGENAGRVLSGRMERDIIGTYYNYTLALGTRDMNTADYDALYEVLTAPVNCHTIRVPYGQGTKTFEAYIASADDDLLLLSELNLWAGLKINFVAMEPDRRPS